MEDDGGGETQPGPYNEEVLFRLLAVLPHNFGLMMIKPASGPCKGTAEVHRSEQRY
jgi:hypothetical protein